MNLNFYDLVMFTNDNESGVKTLKVGSLKSEFNY